MIDASLYIGDKIAAPVVSRVQHRVVEIHKDHYNLQQVKEMVLNSLALIEGKVDIILNVDFKTARDALASWERSNEAPTSPTQMANLILARDCARKAIHSVQDPRDKLSALSILLLAEYKLVVVAREDANDWSSAKEHVQSLFEQFVLGFRELRTAAQEELGFRRRNILLMRSPSKRRDLLRQFMTLKTNLAKLPPTGKSRDIMMNVNEDVSLITKAAKRVMGCQPVIRCRESVACCCVVEGQKILTGGKALRLWNLIAGKQVFELLGHTAQISCCHALGNRALSGGYDKTLRLWDLLDGTELKVLNGHTNWIWCCRLFQGGRKALSGGIDRTLRVWDLDHKKQLFELSGHDDWIRCCTVFDCGRKALAGDDANILRYWNLQNGLLLGRLVGHRGFVTCCAVFEDSVRAVSGSFDKILVVWNIAEERILTKLEGHVKAVTCCAIAGCGRLIVSGGADKTLRVWSSETGTQLQSYSEHSDRVLSCSVFGCETMLATGSSDRTLRTWELSQQSDD